MRSGQTGIFCLEGDWDSNLTDRTSIEPQLRMLKNMGSCGGVIHRDVPTVKSSAATCASGSGSATLQRSQRRSLTGLGLRVATASWASRRRIAKAAAG